MPPRSWEEGKKRKEKKKNGTSALAIEICKHYHSIVVIASTVHYLHGLIIQTQWNANDGVNKINVDTPIGGRSINRLRHGLKERRAHHQLTVKSNRRRKKM